MIDDRLLSAYLAELEALGTHGAEFAREYPDIASELDIASRTSRDGSVERVVESTAFLAARLRLLIESNSAELPATVLSMLAPVLIEPVPSMAIVGLEGGTEPRPLPRGVKLDYRMGRDSLFCFATTMDTVLAPLRLTVRRAAPAARALDALSVRLDGEIPSRLYLYLGRNSLSAAILLDAIGKSLVGIEAAPPHRVGYRLDRGRAVVASLSRLLLLRPGAARPSRFTPSVPALHRVRQLRGEVPLHLGRSARGAVGEHPSVSLRSPALAARRRARRNLLGQPRAGRQPVARHRHTVRSHRPLAGVPGPGRWRGATASSRRTRSNASICSRPRAGPR